MKQSVKIRFPEQQRKPLSLGMGLIALVTGFMCLVLPWQAALFIFPQWLVLVALLIRLSKVEWLADESGLTVVGYFFTRRIDHGSIRRVVAHTRKNSVRVEGERGTGVSMPVGTSMPTDASRERARSHTMELAELWQLPRAESADSGVGEFGTVRQYPPGTRREWGFRGRDGLVLALLSAPIIILLVVRAF
jgi:hypothetical protein